MRDIERRLRKLEGLLPPDGIEPILIRVAGGVPGNDLHASIGTLRLYADPGESRAMFESRCLDEAALLGEGFVVCGGLPE